MDDSALGGPPAHLALRPGRGGGTRSGPALVLASGPVLDRCHPRAALLLAALCVACERPATPALAPGPAASGPAAPSDGAAPPGGPGPAPAAAAPPAPPPAPGAAPADPSIPGSPAAPPAAPLAPVEPPPVELLEAQALIPGATTALRTGEQVTVDPGATFRVLLKGTFPAARLSLLDAADAMQASAGAREAGVTTTLTLQPAAPLRPGSAYRLRVDGATTRELRGADGTSRAPIELALLVAGEPPAEQKARPKKAKKRP